jgi:hypothetical protein
MFYTVNNMNRTPEQERLRLYLSYIDVHFYNVLVELGMIRSGEVWYE